MMLSPTGGNHATLRTIMALPRPIEASLYEISQIELEIGSPRPRSGPTHNYKIRSPVPLLVFLKSLKESSDSLVLGPGVNLALGHGLCDTEANATDNTIAIPLW